MNFLDYEPLARATLKEGLTFKQHVLHMSLGVAGEFGELVDAVKKIAVYGKQPDLVHLTEEVGDVAWYLVCCCKELQVHPGAVQAQFDNAYAQGREELHKLGAEGGVWLMAESLLVLSVAAGGSVLVLLGEKPGTAEATNAVTTVAGALGMACALLGVDPSTALERNVAKLNGVRYKNGFSPEAALNRDLGAERTALEGGPAAIARLQEMGIAVVDDRRRPGDGPAVASMVNPDAV